MDSTDSTAETGAFDTTHDWDGDVSLTYSIVNAVAAVKDVAWTELPPLHDAVDPEALERLLVSMEGSSAQDGAGRVEFPFDGCYVVVTSNGAVTVRPRDAGPE